MKKLSILLSCSLMVSACTSEGLIDQSADQKDKNGGIGFNVVQSSMTRAASSLQSAKHYNFGVFGYKNTDAVHNIMANYLVGYHGENGVGYYMEKSDQTTLGDPEGMANGESSWQYERMGYQEYIYTGGEGFYTKDQTKYMSNIDYQHLHFWDFSSATTSFYAYSPYINGNSTATYDNSTHVLTIPDNSIVAGYDNPTEYEYVYAGTQVSKADYGKDVTLSFKHANARVNIKFWEDIDGYSARIIDLGGTTSLTGVQAAPAVRAGEPGNYTYTKTGASYFEKQGYSVDFTTINAPVLTWATGTETSVPLKFNAPADEFIGTTRLLASPSNTTYYAIPKNNSTGFTFHVSYVLTSNTGETITVHNATAHVPVDNANWEAGKAYTYYFRITRGTNGTTDVPGEIDPADPNVPDVPALFPIIFDNCTIEDYTPVESDYNITDDTNLRNFSVSLDNSQVMLANVTAQNPAEVTPTLYLNGTAQPSPAGTWSVEYPAGVTPEPQALVIVENGKIKVKSGAKTGIYNVVYTPDQSDNAPNSKYTTTLTVVGNKTVEVSTAEIGTGGIDKTEMNFTVKDNGETITPNSNEISIVYPAELIEEQKGRVYISNGKIVVEKNAIGGTYAVKYSSSEGEAQASFTVKQYTFTLSTSEINHNNTDQTITIQTSEGGSISLGGTYDGISLNDHTITIEKGTAAGTYTVFYEVDNNGSKTKYKRTFTVKNVYVLSLDKTSVNVNGSPADRTVTITASKNSVAETGVTSIKILKPAGGEVDNLNNLNYVVPEDAAVGTYKVIYSDGNTIVKTADFVVKNI